MYEFKLPDLGEGVHEGEVLHWHVEIGQVVGEDEPLVDVETDKAAVTIPSPKGGKLLSRAGEQGDIVIVGTVLCTIDDGSGGAAPAPAKKEEPAAAVASQGADLHQGVANQVASASAASNGSNTTPAPSTGGRSVGPHPESAAGQGLKRALAAPATRRLAREKGIDINQVPGSGPSGRVTPDDVLSFQGGVGSAVGGGVDARDAQYGGDDGAASAPVTGGGVPFLDVQPLPDYEKFGAVEKVQLRSIRRKIARRMTTSAIMAPHVYHMDEADVTEMEAGRRVLREQHKKEGISAKITLLAYTTKAVVRGLMEVPDFNASIDAVKEEIVYKKFFNIGIAVSAPGGLTVPVIRDCDRKTVTEIAHEIVEVATKAREGSLSAQDFQGGCFTLTNMGALGGTNAIPMVNYPEVAILAMARTQQKPVVRDGQVVIRDMLPLTLSFDHRIADGSHAAAFMNPLVARLSNPARFAAEV